MLNFVESGNPSEDIPDTEDFDDADVLVTLSLIDVIVAGELLPLLEVVFFIRVVVGLRRGAELEEAREPEVTSVMDGCCCWLAAFFVLNSDAPDETEFPEGPLCKDVDEEGFSILFPRGRKIIVSEFWKSCADDDDGSCCGEPRRLVVNMLDTTFPSFPCVASWQGNTRTLFVR